MDGLILIGLLVAGGAVGKKVYDRRQAHYKHVMQHDTDTLALDGTELLAAYQASLEELSRSWLASNSEKANVPQLVEKVREARRRALQGNPPVV